MARFDCRCSTWRRGYLTGRCGVGIEIGEEEEEEEEEAPQCASAVEVETCQGRGKRTREEKKI